MVIRKFELNKIMVHSSAIRLDGGFYFWVVRDYLMKIQSLLRI